jgi:hypothetical protein
MSGEKPMDATKPPEIPVEEKKVSDLTVADLKGVIREMVEEMLKPLWDYIFELEEQLPDPDEGRPLKPEVEAELRELAKQPLRRGMGKSLEQVMRERDRDE